MVFGVPKEIMHGEKRVSVIPETAAKLIQAEHTVLVQTSAGEGSFYSDGDYTAVGAQLVEDPAELYEKAQAILKVKEPQFNKEKNLHEIDMMHSGQYLITFIHPASPVNHDMVRNMAAKGVIGLTLDGVPRISRAQKMDALTSMSTCAGYKGMIMAVNDLPRFAPQIFCAVGMIKPVQVLVVGTGVGGLQALATAKRLGAVTHAVDIRPDAAEQAKSLGAKLIDTGVPAEIAVGTGGYANALPGEWLEKERAVLAEQLPQMDVVFLSALVPGKIAPILLTKEMLSSMKPGSVVVDISIDQGGNCAATVPGETTVVEGVTVNGIKNIPGLLPASSTWMFANNIYNLVEYLLKDGALVLDREDEIVSSILTTIGGEIVHQGTREAMGI